MSKYGEAAIIAVQLLKEGAATEPRDAWTKATKKVFPTSIDLQNKGCPRGAFLGLCNEGMIVGVPPGDYSNPTKNGSYAVNAVNILRTNRLLSSQPNLLWKKAVGSTKSENHQMNVVVGLWEANCINS